MKIYRESTAIRGTKYQSYLISCFANGKRQRRRFADFADASREAKKVAGQKAQGALGAGALTAANRVGLEQALTLLAANEGTDKATTPRLIEIVRDYANATKTLPVGATLAEAVEFFAKRHPSNMARRTVNEALSATDLSELERMLVEAGIGAAADVNRAKQESHGVGIFIRSLVGLDREAAKQAFAKFLTGKAPTANQIEFINLIIEHLTEHGIMDAARLYESPFTDITPHGPDGLFAPAQVDEMVALLDDVRRRAVAA